MHISKVPGLRTGIHASASTGNAVIAIALWQSAVDGKTSILRYDRARLLPRFHEQRQVRLTDEECM
jgi:hypothetical protein